MRLTLAHVAAHQLDALGAQDVGECELPSPSARALAEAPSEQAQRTPAYKQPYTRVAWKLFLAHGHSQQRRMEEGQRGQDCAVTGLFSFAI